MNAAEEQMRYKDALETGLLNGDACYRRVDAAIQDMEAEAAEKRMPLRSLLRIAIPAAILLIAGTAVAAGILLTGKGSRIRFFSNTDRSDVRAQQGYYERHSDAVEDKALDAQGNTVLTVENIAIHRERVTVFYSADAGHGEIGISLSVNGGAEREPVGIEHADAGQTQGVMASFVVFPEVPQECSLTVRFYGEDRTLLSEREYAVDLTQGGAEDMVILSGKTVHIDGTYSEEPEPPYRP